MLRFPVSALFLSLAFASAAHAQDRGPPERDLQTRLALLRNQPEQVKVNCWKLGCVVIVNETATYEVTGFYVNSARPGKKAHWSPNQLDTPLQPSRATLRFKTGNADTCNIPVRFVLLRRDTGDKAEIEGNTSFCTSPHKDSLIRLRLSEGKVYVRGDDEEPAPEAN